MRRNEIWLTLTPVAASKGGEASPRLVAAGRVNSGITLRQPTQKPSGVAAYDHSPDPRRATAPKTHAPLTQD